MVFIPQLIKCSRLKPGVAGLISLLSLFPCAAQLYIGSDANSLFIKAGESFSYEGLTLTPSTDFALSNTTLSRTDAKTISPAPSENYIARYFSFSNTTPAFTGTIRFSYSGALLTPLSAGTLELNIRSNGSIWANISGTDMNGSNYVEAIISGSRTLNTLTLASNIAPLPVVWLQFTATKKDNAALLNWTTASEINTQDFLVQHSTGNAWKNLGAVDAVGNSSVPVRYSYVHSRPVLGWNYYRLVQRDRDGTNSNSGIVSVLMDRNGLQTVVCPNPIQNGQLNLILSEPALLKLYDATGRIVLSQYLIEGSHVLNVEGLQGGLYQLSLGNDVLPVIIP